MVEALVGEQKKKLCRSLWTAVKRLYFWIWFIEQTLRELSGQPTPCQALVMITKTTEFIGANDWNHFYFQNFSSKNLSDSSSSPPTSSSPALLCFNTSIGQTGCLPDEDTSMLVETCRNPCSGVKELVDGRHPCSSRCWSCWARSSGWWPTWGERISWWTPPLL